MKQLKALLASALLIALSLLPVTAAMAVDTNLITNPSFETASGTAPASWTKGSWGTNTPTFTYEATGHTGSRSATVKLASYTSGDAKWFFAPVTVTAGTKYTFSDWYKSTVASEVDAVVTSTTGATSYYWIGTYAANSAWTQVAANFTAPANAKTLTFYHVIYANGSLTTDDYSLTAPGSTPTPPTTPTVSLSTPANNTTVSGIVPVNATATDTQGISSVQFKLDGANVGAADTTAPYSINWDTTTATNATHVLSAVATNTSNLTATATNINVTVNNVAAPASPQISFTAPAANASVTGTTAITASASDATGVTSVQFKIDGTAATTIATAPYIYNWDTTKVANGSHTLIAIATNQGGATTTATENVTVTNPTAPTVSITTPAANATVSGTQTVSASATSNVAITSVQFKLDGANVGSPVTASPYTISWNTASVANGAHSLTVVATNAANQSTTSAAVSVTVNNVVTPPANPSNLVPNPSVETIAGSLPANWHGDGWGTNTATETYEADGHTGSHSLKVTVSKYTSGDAKWYFDDATVTPGQNYSYSNWYKSSVDTEIDAQVTSTSGAVSYYYIGTASASPTNWAQFKAQFIAPTNAKSITFFQVITAVGYVQTDDYSLGVYTPAQFNRGMVSLTFDDGWRTQYTTALPMLQKYNMHATFYLLTSTVTYPDYMTTAMMQTLKTNGNELADHTQTHPHLPTLTVAQIDQEMGGSQTQLRSWFGNDGVVASNFATPYGEYNTTVLTEAKKYFRSHRSTDDGYNSKDSFDIYNIRVQNIVDATTPAQVAAWVAQAQKDKTWLVLVYHIVSADPAANSEDYSVTPANLETELQNMQQSGIAVQTVDQALNEIAPQL